jgi:hypothetical protein
MRDERGQGTVLGLLLTLVLVLLAAGIVDLARLWEYRAWGYRVAESAALAGLGESRDYAGYVATGAISLDAAVAYEDAVHALEEALAQRPDVTAVVYDVRVHEHVSASTYPGYPPVPRAGMAAGDWSPTGPAVGVYLEFAVEPLLYGWIQGNRPVSIHVFAAASVVTAE